MSDIDTKSSLSPKLIRFIARKMHDLSPAQWKELSEEDRKKHSDQARSLLKSERNFLNRMAKGKAGDEDDD